ncbi:hypothetical protein, partial [Propionivibrio sp.]|uniref:hypothetical protein n=1 Tax=Propionivibrio sp. TaxID=2212460 RepID=UPI003BF0A6C1
MSNQSDIYMTETPFGPVSVTFPEEFGVTFDGNPAAVTFLKMVIEGSTNCRGMSMSETNIEPHDFYYCCQSKESGVTIVPPLDFFDNEEYEEEDGLVMDGANDIPTSLADLRRAIRTEKSVLAKVALMGDILRAVIGRARAEPTEPQAPRNPTAHYYEYDP